MDYWDSETNKKNIGMIRGDETNTDLIIWFI